MSGFSCRGPARFLLLAFLVLWVLILAYILTDSEARSSLTSQDFNLSSFSHNVFGKIKSVFNGTRFRFEPEKSPIIWARRDPAFAKLASSSLVHVALTTSGASLGGAIATINSVHLNTRRAVRFHIFAPDRGDVIQHLSNWITKTHLREIDYEIIPFNESLVPSFVTSSSSSSSSASSPPPPPDSHPPLHPESSPPMTFARFFAPTILRQRPGGSEIRRLIHLDDDVILQGDIFHLANLTFGEKQKAAFANDCTGRPKHSLRSHLVSAFVNLAHQAVLKLKIPPQTCAMNTGVYVVDVDDWIDRDVTRRLLAWLAANHDSKGDIFDHQREIGHAGPPLMLEYFDKYLELAPMWHVRGLGDPSGQRHSSHFLEKAHLLHYSGPVKPWGRLGEAMGQAIWDTYYLPDPWRQFKVLRKAKSKSTRLD